jgi:hypothetical protein
MRIDDNTVAQARAADMVAFLEKYNGFTFAHRGGEYRCEQHPSLAVKHDRLSWYWHSKGVGGHGVLDYLTKIDNMPFRQAVESVCGISSPTAPPPLRVNLTRQEAEPPKVLVLPEKKGIPLRLYDYLCKKRGIHGDIVNTLIQEEKLYEDKRGNVIFVGHDEQGKPRFATVRGTQVNYGFRMDCVGSDKRYGFNMVSDAPSNSLYVFESAIDAMSHATLAIAENGDKTAWEYDRRLSLAGTSDAALPFFLNQHKDVKELVFCLDNDLAGRVAAQVMQYEYSRKGYTARIDLPRGKDYNEDLQAHIAQTRAAKRTNSLHRDVDI